MLDRGAVKLVQVDLLPHLSTEHAALTGRFELDPDAHKFLRFLRLLGVENADAYRIQNAGTRGAS
jgi:hypothetical protein